MIEGGGGDRGVLRGLGQDKGALDHRLGMECEALCSKVSGCAVLADRCRDVGLERCRMPARAEELFPSTRFGKSRGGCGG